MGCVQVGKVSGGGTAATLSSARWRWKPSTHHRDDQVQKKPKKKHHGAHGREREPSQPKKTPQNPHVFSSGTALGDDNRDKQLPGSIPECGDWDPDVWLFFEKKETKAERGKAKKDREREGENIHLRQPTCRHWDGWWGRTGGNGGLGTLYSNSPTCLNLPKPIKQHRRKKNAFLLGARG